MHDGRLRQLVEIRMPAILRNADNVACASHCIGMAESLADGPAVWPSRAEYDLPIMEGALTRPGSRNADDHELIDFPIMLMTAGFRDWRLTDQQDEPR